jgi:CRP-like cAMP-binding protein
VPVVPLTQEDLAAMAGTSRATVNRVLREDEKRGSVKLERGRVVVLDADGLGRRCSWGPL